MLIHADGLGPVIDLVHDERWDRDRLIAEIAARTALLGSLGVGPGARVVLAQDGRPGFFADLFAVWQRGACAVCINPALSAEEIGNVVQFVDPLLCLANDGFTATTDIGVRVLNAGEAKPAGGTGDDAVQDTGLDDPALILFTSGTTGVPKGVVHTFRSILARVALNRTHIGDATLARTLCVLPVHFGHGLIGNCLTPLFAGAALYLSPGINVQAAARLGAAIDDQAITFLSSVPTLWKLVLKTSKPPKGESLRQISIGSAPLSAELWNAVVQWSGLRNVVNMYGITETANWLGGASAAAHAPADGLIGRMWGGAMAVRDESGTLHAEGQGEILVQSPSLMQGYYRRPELTREVLDQGWYATGDIGAIDADGVARLSGRQKDEINRAGIKIHPADIDLLLERHEQVAEACTFGIPDAISGEIVGVAVAAVDGVALRPEDLRTWCLERVRREAAPEKWFLVDQIPKTDRGKVNRAKVRDHCLKQPA